MTPQEIRRLIKERRQVEPTEDNDWFGMWWSKHFLTAEIAGELDASYPPHMSWAEVLSTEVPNDDELAALWARYQLEK